MAFLGDATRPASTVPTGSDDVDALLERVARHTGRLDDVELLTQMLASVVGMGTDGLDRRELKLVRTALAELRDAFRVLDRSHGVRKCAIFGSARSAPTDPISVVAREVAAAMARHDWMVVTGGGPGVMTAGIEGAGVDNAYALTIELPFESVDDSPLAGDDKLLRFRYFFTRKLVFMKESHGFVLVPGGFGTLDESFELLTLMQTGRHPVSPVVLLDAPGDRYWTRWLEFVRAELVDQAMIGAEDLDLVVLTDSVDRAVDELTVFYRRYHSMRYVDDRLVLRLSSDLDDDALAALNRRFADIAHDGRIERVDAAPEEIADDDVVDLPRIALRFDRRRSAGLRRLIDAVNEHERPV